MRTAAHAPAVVLVLAALACAPACGGSASLSAQQVRVTIEDFRIKAPAHVPSGAVVFLVHNKGPDEHEFIVVRASRPLPLRADGVTADEDAFEKLTAGVLEPGAPGETRRLDVRLEPGRYELICNMSGHYLGGMRKQIVVDP
jgi:uncharacterized cupredoxin-like copper-binding protein